MDRTRSSKALTNPDQPSLTDREDLLGQALLSILSRGGAILAEILRLGERIPKEVLVDQSDFLFRFEEYFNDPERTEAKLNKVASSVQADEDFQAKNQEYLQRFYNVCAGIIRITSDFNRMTRELRKGYFLSHSLEQALIDPDGKQWIPECLHVVGASLLLLNEKFPGTARERLIVAQYRLKGEAVLTDFEQVIALVRDFEIPQKASSATGTSSPSEILLSRLNIDGRLARAIISRIQADDIYGHTRAWPLAEHRSTALANQASLLYIALLFAEAGLKSKRSQSEILPLSNGRAEMREIVDKHFSDQWVVVVCIGFTVDLEVEWSYFPAARMALSDVTSRIKSLKSFNRTQARRVQNLLDERLTRGVLTERYVTDNWDALLEVLREANAMLRWRILHGKTKTWESSMTATSSSRSSKDNQADPGLTPAETIRLLMGTAQLEHVLREAIRRVLASKDETWRTCRERVSERMIELSQYFSGQVPLARVQKDEELMKWFQGLGEEVGRLEYLKTPTAAGRRVQALIKALEEVEKFDGVDSSLQVREFLSDSRSLLEKMVRTVTVREEILAQIDVISDLSYAWGGVLSDYDQVWHDRVRQDPSSVGLLRAVFIKFSSVLDVALARLAQAGSSDVDSVAEYWSKKLVGYVKRVLEVVPQSVCSVLDAVGEVLDKLPDTITTTRYQLSELGVFAAGEFRYELARLTHKIAIFTGGVLTMGKCVLGIVEVDPKKVLDEGLRRELRRRMVLVINQSPTPLSTAPDAWKQRLSEKAKEIQRLRRAFEYVQDYLTLDGTRTWNEELSKVVVVNDNPFLLILAKQLGTMAAMDWSNERLYEPVLEDLWKLLGTMGLVQLEFRLCQEQKTATLEFLRNTSNCDVALTQLNLPAGIVWGSANWVESVRESRRKYPYDHMENDLKCLARIGTLHIARTRIRFRLAKEAEKNAPLLAATVRASFLYQKRPGPGSLGQQPYDGVDHVLAMALGLVNPPPCVHYDVLDELSTARRVFILLNELAKRMVTSNINRGVFGNHEFYFCCAGVATFCHSKQFTQELERCVFADARALCLKSLLERQTAESSVLFKFGAQKVAKVAMERLVQEQALHRVVAQIAGRKNDTARAPIFMERIGEIWTSAG